MLGGGASSLEATGGIGSEGGGSGSGGHLYAGQVEEGEVT